MRAPESLYTLTPAADEVPAGLHVVVALTGFADAGGAIGQLGRHVLGELSSSPVAVFDNDALLDYRSRRPIATFAEDHISDWDPPRLELSLAADDLGEPFLLLTGYEPDFAWDGFVQALLDLFTRFAVAGSTWAHAIPMPVPHTRPVGMTVSGTRSDLIERLSVWRPHTQVLGTVLHLLEHKLWAEGAAVSGVAILVPHYLADTEFPAAAIAAIDGISQSSGLILPTDALRAAGRSFVAKVDEQVADNDELGRMLEGLEERYDSYMAGTMPRSPLTAEDGEVPSADELAEELERFLHGRRSGGAGGSLGA